MYPSIWHHIQVHCPLRIQEETWRTGKVLTWMLLSDLDKTSYKQDKTSSQIISPIVKSNFYITKQGLRDRIWYQENGVPKNWIWPQKCEILWRGHPLIPLVSPKKVHRCPKKPPEDLAKFWLKMPLLTFWSIVGSFLHRYASVIPFWKAETLISMVLKQI